jgi:WD40 repeat protein
MLIRVLFVLLIIGIGFLQGEIRGSAFAASSPEAEKPSAAVSSLPPLVPEGEVFQDLPELLANISRRAQVLSLAFSPNGKLLASGSDDGMVRLWDVASGREFARFEGHKGWVWSVAFGPDGTSLVSGGEDGTVRVWDTASGREIARLSVDKGSVNAVAFSPDGTSLVSGGDDGTVKVWDVAGGREIARLQGHGSWVLAVAFSPDGERVASGAIDGTVSVWDVAGGREIALFRAHDKWARSVAFSPNGKLLASGSYDDTVRVYDMASGREFARLEGHKNSVLSVVFSPDGARLASGAADGTARVWDVAGAREIERLEGHKDQVVWSVVFSPDGAHLASGGGDGTVRLWDAASKREIARFSGHKDAVNSVAFSPDGVHFASGGNEGTVWLWEAATGKAVATLDRITAVAFSADGKHVLTGSEDNTARLWDAATGKAVATLAGHTDLVTAVAFSPDGERILTGSTDKTARLWDAATGKAAATLAEHTDRVTAVAFSPDGKRVLTGSADKTARLWDATSGKAVATLAEHTDRVTAVAFSPDGKRVLTGSADKTARLWDAATGKAVATLAGHTDRVTAIAFSPDGKHVLTGSGDKTARLWDAATGKAVATLAGHTNSVNAIAFSPDGTHVLTGSEDKTARLWDATTGKAGATLVGHTAPVTAVAFSPNGAGIISGSDDATLRLWDAVTGRPLGIGVAGARGNWLACVFPEQRCWRADDGTLLVRRNSIGFVTGAVPVLGAEPVELTAFADAKVRIEERYPAELPVTIRNNGVTPAYWVRIISPVQTVARDRPCVVAAASKVIQRLDPGRSETVAVLVAAQLPHHDPGAAKLSLPLTLEALARDPMSLPPIEIDLPSPAPRLGHATLVQGQSGAASISAELRNIGSAGLVQMPDIKAEPENAEGKSLGDASSASVPPDSTLPADHPEIKRPLSIALASSTDLSALKRLKVIVADTQNPLHEWTLDVPVSTVGIARWIFAAAALATVALLLAVGYQLVYRNPLTVQLSTQPAALLDLDPERLARARRLLGLARRLRDILDRVASNLPWLDAAIAFTRGSARARAEQLAQRLETTLIDPPLITTAGVFGTGLRPPLNFPLKIDELVLLLPDAATPAEDIFAAWRAANLGSRPIGVIVAASSAQRAQLARLRERWGDNVVALTGGETTRLLIGPTPVENLARVLAKEIDLTRISPYQINNAVERESVFFGRYQQLRHILERDLGNYILLGARQLGKSSLLKEIERRVRHRGEVAVDYESVLDAPIESVLARLADLSEGASLSDLTAALRVSAAERPRLILLDECDQFVARDAAQNPPFPVMEAMRRLSAGGNCHFVIAGFWQLYEIVHLTYHAPLRNFGETLTLGGLEPEAAHSLLREPMAILGVSWQDETDIERIADDTGRRPNLLQIAGNELLKTLGDRRVIEREDVDLVLRSRPIADSLAGWRTLTDDPRARCLDQIVVWAMLDREAFKLAEVTRHLATLTGRNAVPVDELQSSLQRLDLAFILGEDEGVYRWRVPLFRTRRKLEAPEEQLREQLSRLETLQAQVTPV